MPSSHRAWRTSWVRSHRSVMVSWWCSTTHCKASGRIWTYLLMATSRRATAYRYAVHAGPSRNHPEARHVRRGAQQHLVGGGDTAIDVGGEDLHGRLKVSSGHVEPTSPRQRQERHLHPEECGPPGFGIDERPYAGLGVEAAVRVGVVVRVRAGRWCLPAAHPEAALRSPALAARARADLSAMRCMCAFWRCRATSSMNSSETS